MNNYVARAFKFIIIMALITLIVLLFSLSGFMTHRSAEYKGVSLEASSPTVIVIDPGHGGEDGGAEANGVTEKEINLAVSKNLAAYLSMTSYDTVMTRSDDRLLYEAGQENRKKYHDISNRIKIASSYENAIFISVHQNKFEIPKYRGLQVYYSPNDANSSNLASIIQSNVKTYIDPSNGRETKKADGNIRVLKSLKVPAVLIECGFLSNPEEAKMLSDTEYQKKLAFVTFISTLEFLQQNGEKSNEV